jgi:hypothetical protein
MGKKYSTGIVFSIHFMLRNFAVVIETGQTLALVFLRLQIISLSSRLLNTLNLRLPSISQAKFHTHIKQQTKLHLWYFILLFLGSKVEVKNLNRMVAGIPKT